METLFLSPLAIVIIASIVGFFMAYGIGANDVANAMGTSVGSKAITLKQAIIIAAIFEFLGAYFGGGEVTSTIRKGIVDPTIYEDANKFIIGMLSSIISCRNMVNYCLKKRLASFHNSFNRWCNNWFCFNFERNELCILGDGRWYSFKLGDIASNCRIASIFNLFKCKKVYP